MSEGNEGATAGNGPSHTAGRSSARFVSQPAEGKGGKDKAPVVVQQSPMRPTYSYPGSVAKPDIYSKFRFITEEMMEQVICEAQESLAKKPNSKGSRKHCLTTSEVGNAGYLESEVSKSQFDKWVKQIKWFWLEIEDYLREIETVYNEVRLHVENFEAKRKDKEEELRRNRRIADFNSRSCRIVYDLQQQTKDVFAYLDNSNYILSRAAMKKLHGIHRGVVTALHNLLTRLPDYDLDRGLPPVYHQLAMLIRRLAQCCFKLGIGQDVHIIRNLEGIRQKVEDASHGQETGPGELPLYRMTTGSKKPPNCVQWDSKGLKTCPVVWQEYEAHMKGKRIPRNVPNKILDMVDVTKRQGFIAPVHLQAGIDRYLRIKSPLMKRTEGKGKGATIAGKLLNALGRPNNITAEEYDTMAQRFKKLQQEFISEVEGQISARLKPLLQEAKKVADAHAKGKKVVTVGHVQIEPPKDPFAKQKLKIDEVLGYYTGATKVENDPPIASLKESPLSLDEGWGDHLPEHILDAGLQAAAAAAASSGKKKNRSRSPVTIRQRSESKMHLAAASASSPSAEKIPRGRQTESKGFKIPRRTLQPGQTSSRRLGGAVASTSGLGRGGTSAENYSDGDHQPRHGYKIPKAGSKGAKSLVKVKAKNLSRSIQPDGKDAAAVYTMQEGSRESAGPGAVAKEDSELQWTMKGNMSVWSPNQIDDMLYKLKDMENEEKAIRHRWQDLLHVDPSVSASESNYRIAYGERPTFSETKDPDAILLVKPSKQKDTVVVVTAMSSRKEDEANAIGTHRDNPESSRARGGVDLAAKCLSYLRGGHKEEIKTYCDKFDDYLKRTSHYAVGNFDPWKVVVEVADDILNDLFLEVSSEIAEIPEACVKQIYDAEFDRT